MSDDAQRYAGNNHILAPGIHIATTNPSFLLRLGEREWLTEWHYYFGPSVLNKRTLDPAERQPGEKSPFWLIAQWWKDQGCKVVDGVGVWEEPPIEVATCVKTGRQVRFWKGYANYGPVRNLLKGK